MLILTNTLILIGIILKLEFVKDGMNESQLFDDRRFWNLTENRCDKRSPENSSTDCNMFHVELKSNANDTCKNSEFTLTSVPFFLVKSYVFIF